MELVFRTPCTFHKNCDETSVGLLHRSSSDGQPRDDEKQCMVCEGMFKQIRESLLKTGLWVCPVCGFMHRFDGKEIVPPLSKWYNALSIEKTR